MRFRLIPLVLLVAGSAGVLGFGIEDPRLASVSNYRRWELVTKEPVDMSPRLAVLCRGPLPWEGGANPHDPKVFRVFVNQTGKPAMLSPKSRAFPDGSIIVKEKFARNGKLDKPELLTVMAKRRGVWDYFTVASDGKSIGTESGPCQKCHSARAKDDYVFRTYRPSH